MTKKKIYHIPIDVLPAPEGPKSVVQKEYVDAHTSDRENPHGVTPNQLDVYTTGQTDEKIAAAVAPKANTSDVEDHIEDIGNPHEVTAEQVGAYTKEQTDGKIIDAVDSKAESADVQAHIDAQDNPHGVTPGQIGAATNDLATQTSPGLMSPTDKVKLDGVTSANLMKRYVHTIVGDGSTTSWTLTHNIGTSHVLFQAVDQWGDFTIFKLDSVTDTQATLSAAVAPAATDSFVVLIVGTGV